MNNSTESNLTTNVTHTAAAAAAHYTLNEQAGAFFLLIFFSAIGGVFMGVWQGFHFPGFWFIKPFHWGPMLFFKKIVVPPLVVMIIFGCIAKNFFGEVMNPYPQAFTKNIRGFCLSILLIRGGM
jgi:uncharacterized protein with NAD-binding domain and iron-sulfur cluster